MLKYALQDVIVSFDKINYSLDVSPIYSNVFFLQILQQFIGNNSHTLYKKLYSEL